MLSGAKNWITNSPIADICLARALNTVSFLLMPSLSLDPEVWAKTDTDEKASRHIAVSTSVVLLMWPREVDNVLCGCTGSLRGPRFSR